MVRCSTSRERTLVLALVFKLFWVVEGSSDVDLFGIQHASKRSIDVCELSVTKATKGSSIIGCASLCSTHLSCHAFEMEDVDQRCKLLRKWCLNYDNDGQTMRTIFEAPSKHDDWSRLIIIGGKEDTATNIKSTIEVIDLEDAKVCPSLPSLSQPIFYSGAEILGDKFLSIGGSYDISIESPEIQAYDPLYKTWTNFGTLPNTNSHFPTVKLEDHWILTLGGWEADAPSANTYQIFLNGSVSRGPDLPHTGYGIGATAIGKNYVFMVGAFTDNLRNVYILNWEQQTFEEQSPLTLNRRYAQCQPYRDRNNVLKILVVGGTSLSDPSGPTPADIFVWESKTWLPGPSLEHNHYHSRLVKYDGNLFILGGSLGMSYNFLSVIYKFHSKNESWTTFPLSVPVPLREFAVVTAPREAIEC